MYPSIQIVLIVPIIIINIANENECVTILKILYTCTCKHN